METVNSTAPLHRHYCQARAELFNSTPSNVESTAECNNPVELLINLHLQGNSGSHGSTLLCWLLRVSQVPTAQSTAEPPSNCLFLRDLLQMSRKDHTGLTPANNRSNCRQSQLAAKGLVWLLWEAPFPVRADHFRISSPVKTAASQGRTAGGAFWNSLWQVNYCVFGTGNTGALMPTYSRNTKSTKRKSGQCHICAETACCRAEY